MLKNISLKLNQRKSMYFIDSLSYTIMYTVHQNKKKYLYKGKINIPLLDSESKTNKLISYINSVWKQSKIKTWIY